MRRERLWYALACTGAAALVAAWCWHMVLCLWYPYPLGYGEGVTAFWLQAPAWYPAPASGQWLHNPYPPLGYVLASGLSWLGGHPFLALRVLSVLAALACAALVVRYTWRRCGRWGALIAVALVLGSPLWWHYGVYARVDALGVALSLSTLLLITQARRPWHWVLAGLCAAAAVLVKPVFVAAACTLMWTAWRRGTWRLVFPALLGLPILAFVVGILFSAEGTAWWQHLVVLNRLDWQLGQLVDLLATGLARHALLAAVVVGFLAQQRRHDPWWLYAWLVVVVLILTGGKPGSDGNYLLEAMTLAVFVAVRVAQANPGLRPLLVSAALVQLAMFAPVSEQAVFTASYGQEVVGGGAALTPGADDREVGTILSKELASSPGPVLSDDLGYLLCAGHSPVFQPYQFGQLHRLDRWDDAPLVEQVSNKHFSLVLVRRDDSYLTPSVLAAVQEHYVLRREVGPWLVYATEFSLR
ncbi:MAG: glycosyltransferase family 39 protein [Planctomycetota bacterium]|jgi:4-amino-4-deoxy-L-arabinose transferase-like glycosyltransferase|nr:glycosyltransferase family 39 protein [Planctomycetota bacterium]